MHQCNFILTLFFLINNILYSPSFLSKHMYIYIIYNIDRKHIYYYYHTSFTYAYSYQYWKS